MPALKAILWDMDGVLTDTIQLHFDVWEQILGEHHIPYDRRKFQNIYGLKDREFLPHLVDKPLDSDQLDSITSQKQLAFTKAVYGHVQPLPGVIDWLIRFRSWGYKQAVASSAPLHNVEAIVDTLNIRQYFQALITPGTLPGKPDPTVFLIAAEALETPAQDCIVIEDAIPGIIAAHRAGMRCIAVATAKPPVDLAQADIVVKTLAELTIEQFETLL
jgi:HAD superfamily hydrolase (TIGR01509 family)